VPLKIIIAVHDLITQKSHLMPWRTVCDVVKHLQELGHEAHVLSLNAATNVLEGAHIPAGTFSINKSKQNLKNELTKVIQETGAEIIFWPVAWREQQWRTRIVTSLGLPVVGWFPGGIYSLSTTLYATKVIGLWASRQYLLEAVASKRKQVAFFLRSGVTAIVTMTATTAKSAVDAGWPEAQVYVIPPGKENSPPNKSLAELPTDFLEWKHGEPYFLFMGPPSGIRGIFELLSAFERAVQQESKLRLVCLFRSDADLDMNKIKSRLAKISAKKNIYCRWESLSLKELNAFMANSHAVVMPFVLVPSEIPLAIIEAMAWGKPIISTSPGGTGEFVTNLGAAPEVGDINSLSKAMIDLLCDVDSYNRKCQAVIDCYENHPTWFAVAKQWEAVAEKVLAQPSKEH
jgi:glycosyltransferase involved in cell wall biosynthesis